MLVFVDLFRFRLLDLMPVAHATLVESLLDGVLVVDARGRFVDLNPAAWRLLGDVEGAGAYIGRDARGGVRPRPRLARFAGRPRALVPRDPRPG